MGNYESNERPSGILWNGMFDDFCELSPLWMGELHGPGQPFDPNWPTQISRHHRHHQKHTPPKFNIAPENGPSQKESSIPTTTFKGLG